MTEDELKSDDKQKWQDKMPKWRNPPTDEQIRRYFGGSLVKRYVELFERRVKRQPNFAELTLHVIVGQLPAIKKLKIHVGENDLDLRISGCFFKPSGSGGGRGFNFMSRIAMALNLNFRSVTEITDAALIGTTDECKEYDPERKGFVIVKHEIRGALDPRPDPEYPERLPASIVAMNEADILFSSSSSEYKKNAMLYYQIALNTMGTEDNKLSKKLSKGDWIEFYPECSLILMSYPPDCFFETIVKRGFLQRMVIIYNDLTTEDRKAVAKELTRLLEVSMDKEGDMDDLITRLKYVDEFWRGKEEIRVGVTPQAKAILERLVDEFFVPFEGVAEYQRKKLEEFSQRWIEHTWKIAWHHMLLRLDNVLRLEDVGYAKNYVMPVWKQLIALLEEGISPPRDKAARDRTLLTEALRCYQEICAKTSVKVGGLIQRAEYCRILSNNDWWGVSYKTASTRISGFEEAGYFERQYEGTAPMIRQSKLPKWLRNPSGMVHTPKENDEEEEE